jgi:hemerythrin superfamily protein
MDNNKNIMEIIKKTGKRREYQRDGISLDNRYFGINHIERREPLLKHPCILGTHY